MTNRLYAFGQVRWPNSREPEEAAERVLDVVGKLGDDQKGRVWDLAGTEVVW